MPEIDAISSAAPPPRARRCGRAARSSVAGCVTLRASVCSQSAALVSSSSGPQAAQLACAFVDGRGERRLVGHVGRDAVRAHTERAQLGRRPQHLAGVARAQPDGAALVGQAQDDRPADAARGAGDEGDLAGKPEVHHVVGDGGGGVGAGTGGAGGAGGTGGAARGQRCGPGL
jgi:hypothetical protein